MKPVMADRPGTRSVSLAQITAGDLGAAIPVQIACAACQVRHVQAGEALGLPALRVRPVADAAGGDVFEPLTFVDAGLAEGYRRAKWTGPVPVEVVG